MEGQTYQWGHWPPSGEGEFAEAEAGEVGLGPGVGGIDEGGADGGGPAVLVHTFLEAGEIGIREEPRLGREAAVAQEGGEEGEAQGVQGTMVSFRRRSEKAISRP